MGSFSRLSRLASTVLPLVATVACVRTVVPPGTLAAKSTETVAKVRFVGNRSVRGVDIAEGLALRGPVGWVTWEKTFFDPVALAVDRRRIVAFYKSLGFFSADVTQAKVKRRRQQVYVEFHINEGPRARIATIRVSGVDGLLKSDAEPLRRVAGLRIGKPFVHDRYLRALENLQVFLRHRGYAFVRVIGDVEVDRENAQAHVEFSVDPGPKARFGKVAFKGRGEVPMKSLLARIAWQEGEQFDPELLEQTRSQLFELGVYGVVRFEFDESARTNIVDITVVLGEAKRHERKLGVGVGVDPSRIEARLRFGVGEKQFLHPLVSGNLEVRPLYWWFRDANDSEPAVELTGSLEKEDVLFPRLHFEARGSVVSGQRFPAYNLRGPSSNLSWQRPFFASKVRLALGWDFRYQSITPIDGLPDGALMVFGVGDSHYRVGSYLASASFDTRDNPVAARRGMYASLGLELSSPAAGSTFSYSVLHPDVRGYWNFAKRWVMAGRVRYGVELASQGRLPITQRLFVGGAASHRGFSFQRLSPQLPLSDGGSVPIGGEESIESSAELRFDLYQFEHPFVTAVTLASFVDAADVVALAGSLDLLAIGNYHWASGLGIRLGTIVGVLRIDVARRVNRLGAGEPDAGQAWAAHVSLGEAF